MCLTVVIPSLFVYKTLVRKPLIMTTSGRDSTGKRVGWKSGWEWVSEWMGRALELTVLNSSAEPPQNYVTLLRHTSSNVHFFLFGQRSPVGQGLLLHEVSRSHSTIFGDKKVIKHKTCVLILSAIFVWNISNSKHNSARYYQILIKT